MKTQTSKLKKQNVLLSLCAASLLWQGCFKGESASLDSALPVVNQTCPKDVPSAAAYFEDVQDSEIKVQSKGLRQRLVKVKTEDLKRDLRQNKNMKMELFTDLPVDVIVEGIQNVDRGLVMTGRLSDEEHSAVTLSFQDQVLVGHIHRDDGRHFEIHYEGQDLHSIVETDVEDNECLALPSPVEPEPVIAQDLGMAAIPMIDMLVAYTPAALTKVGGLTAMKALINMGIADTNKAFINSGVGLSVRLVGTMPVSQNESSDFSADLGALRSKTDSKWNEVHAMRTKLGADQVTLVGSYPNNSVAGIGYIKAAASTAFTIVKSSAFSMYTFSHELGHNIGLQHSDGYVNSAGRFRTIMAYGTYPRIRRFSNPNLTYNGYRTGDSDQNSASILNSFGGQFSQMIAVKIPVTDSEPPTAPTSPNPPVSQNPTPPSAPSPIEPPSAPVGCQ